MNWNKIKEKISKLDDAFKKFKNTEIGKFLLKGKSLSSLIAILIITLISQFASFKYIDGLSSKINNNIENSQGVEKILWYLVDFFLPTGNYFIIGLIIIILPIILWLRIKELNQDKTIEERIIETKNNIPDFTSKKYFKQDIEAKVINLLEEQSIVQIYGISGLGKTELTKSISKTLIDNFDSMIWVAEDSLVNTNFESVYISKFNSNVNLKTLLQNNRIILIFDNFNENLNDIKKHFDTYNQKKSICIITSLQENLPPLNSYKLDYLSNKISKNILFETSIKPSIEIANEIIEYINGYPLLLNIIRDSVENGSETWEENIADLKNVVKIDDPEKNKKISIRILEKQLDSTGKYLEWIYLLNSRFISKEFLYFCIERNGIKSLSKRSIISDKANSFYTVHQIMLDSIVDIFEDKINIDKVYIKIEDFLLIENEKKSVGYFNFLFRHNNLIDKVYNESTTPLILKKYILYAKMQKRYDDDMDFLKELDKYNLEEDIKINILLLIEQTEIEVFKNRNDVEFRKEKIEFLKAILSKSNIENIDTYITHHIAKLYMKIDKAKSLSLFNEVLEKNPDADYTKLQIAKLLSWDKENNHDDELNDIFSTTLLISKKWNEESLSVLLALYDVLTINHLFELRKKYIYDDIDNFIEHLFYSLSFESEQSLQLLANLSRNLKYDKRDKFIDICERLPLDISSLVNKNIKYSYAVIYTNYYKVSKQLGNKNIDKIFDIAKATFLSLSLNDYERGNFVSLYIYSKDFQSALIELNKYKKKDAFFYQKSCQIKRELTEYEESLKAIEEALTLNQNYKSDFLNDKAKTLFKQGNKVDAIKVLDDAIQEELNLDIKTSWNKKLENWKKVI